MLVEFAYTGRLAPSKELTFSMLHDKDSVDKRHIKSTSIVNCLNAAAVYGEHKHEFFTDMAICLDILKNGSVSSTIPNYFYNTTHYIIASFVLLIEDRVFEYSFTIDPRTHVFIKEYLVEYTYTKQDKIEYYYIDVISNQFRFNSKDYSSYIDYNPNDAAYKDHYFTKLFLHMLAEDYANDNNTNNIYTIILNWFKNQFYMLDMSTISTIDYLDSINIIKRLSDKKSTLIIFMDKPIDSSIDKHKFRQETIETWLNKYSGSYKQLILFPYHTSLLDIDLLTRDSFWFVQGMPSNLYLTSLYDFTTRFDDKLERAYCDGRYTYNINFDGEEKYI